MDLPAITVATRRTRTATTTTASRPVITQSAHVAPETTVPLAHSSAPETTEPSAHVATILRRQYRRLMCIMWLLPRRLLSMRTYSWMTITNGQMQMMLLKLKWRSSKQFNLKFIHDITKQVILSDMWQLFFRPKRIEMRWAPVSHDTLADYGFAGFVK